MSTAQDLVSLPEEVVDHISKFLEPADLLALSATCVRLRAALNCNSVWRRFSQGGAVSHGLKHLTSIVEPTFTKQQDFSDALEPLCEHRLHFARQSRLFNNYRQGNHVRHSSPFNHFLTDFETSDSFGHRTITYKDEYLFALGYSCNYDHDDASEEVKVYQITGAPSLIKTFKILRHHSFLDYPIIICLEVIEDKLVVRQDNNFDVYEIRLPDLEFPLLNMINVMKSLPRLDCEIIVVRDLIFVENHGNSGSNTIQLWSIHTGTKLSDISPKIEGSDFKICNHPWNEQNVLLSVEVFVGQSSFITPHLYIYSLNSYQYTSFYAIVPTKFIPTNPSNYFGFLDNQYAVLGINDRQNLSSNVFVFDIKSSALLAQNNMESLNVAQSCIVSGCLAIPNSKGVRLVNLSNLETIWQIKFGASNSLNYYFSKVYNINILNLHNFIIVSTPDLTEVWDFEKRRKILDLPGIRFVAMSGCFSKLILLTDSYVETLTFW